MKKQRYLEIRKTLDLQKRTQPLVHFFLTEIGLMGFATGLWVMGARYFVFPVLAVLMFRNFSLMHDASHGAISSDRKVNDLIGGWAGILCLLPFRAWKESHLQHHLWSGNIEKDPVMGLRTALPNAPVFIQKALTFAWRAWIPTLATLQYLLFWKLSAGNAAKAGSVKAWGGVVFPVMAWGAFFAVAPAGFFLTALLPALVFYLIAVEVINFPHHLQLPMSTGDARDPVWEQYKTSRTCIYPKWFARHVVLNFNYHSEHHMFPDAPWYALESIHEVLREELKAEQNVDVLFKWTVDNRSLSLLEVISPSELRETPEKVAG